MAAASFPDNTDSRTFRGRTLTRTDTPSLADHRHVSVMLEVQRCPGSPLKSGAAISITSLANIPGLNPSSPLEQRSHMLFSTVERQSSVSDRFLLRLTVFPADPHQ
ncbi:hypothetical protein E1202_15910 [Saccharopolyspora karakumensis]|uniref:Uncharacterized protein n=1 Tax=Saccharopolyspora karakumensis TaxID=2530386 RepID=A0A4R5BLW4_9PSEU|nr:hypothetical protein [Saccharopolyspora karakumensis]TDD87778.1 hypothetical protein E1202_15910 [Saccharopolyspora karakumensis]